MWHLRICRPERSGYDQDNDGVSLRIAAQTARALSSSPQPRREFPIALGHRRLAVIDTGPRGAQPMSYLGARYWITYNGEVYNFRALREDLRRDGFRFVTETDTEVLLAMYARYGQGMLKRLNGMFALAIWDAESQELFLARDRLGIKPLYWARQDETLCFASEVKALLPLLPRPRMRDDLVPTYLTFLWVPGADTLFEGVYKLEPGHCATFANGRLSLRRWWDMTFEPEERMSTTGLNRPRRRRLGR